MPSGLACDARVHSIDRRCRTGAGVPGPLHFPLPVRYFSGRYFVQGGCSEYLNRPTLQVDRLNAPLPPKGSSLQSAYSFLFRTAQSEAFGFNAPGVRLY